jgi:hypothetical protein
MTDERIREEFDTWISDIECTDNERRFFNQYPSIDQPIAVGFYAGFRAAERLAKIEALEGVLSLANDGRAESLVIDIQDMIAELKEEGE